MTKKLFSHARNDEREDENISCLSEILFISFVLANMYMREGKLPSFALWFISNNGRNFHENFINYSSFLSVAETFSSIVCRHKKVRFFDTWLGCTPWKIVITNFLCFCRFPSPRERERILENKFSFSSNNNGSKRVDEGTRNRISVEKWNNNSIILFTNHNFFSRVEPFSRVFRVLSRASAKATQVCRFVFSVLELTDWYKLILISTSISFQKYDGSFRKVSHCQHNITFAEFRFNFVWASRVNVVRRTIIDTETYITMTFCVCLTHARRKGKKREFQSWTQQKKQEKNFSSSQRHSRILLLLFHSTSSFVRFTFSPSSSPSKHTEFVSHFVVDYVWLLHIHRTTKKRLSDDVMSVRFFHHVMLSPHFHPCYSTHCVSRPLPPLPPRCWNKNKHFSILQNFFFSF